MVFLCSLSPGLGVEHAKYIIEVFSKSRATTKDKSIRFVDTELSFVLVL